MIKNPIAFLLFCSCLLTAAPLAAQVEVVKIDWEISKLAGKERTPYAPVARLSADPAVKFTDYLRALVTLRNKSPKAVEGVVLRYALSLRLLKTGDSPDKAFWCVPYYVEEVRVSKVGAVSERQARVIRFELQNQLSKLRNSGFSPTALKLEVMAGPRQGDEPAAIVREAVIEIVRP
jgi:hypothetical protein